MEFTEKRATDSVIFEIKIDDEKMINDIRNFLDNYSIISNLQGKLKDNIYQFDWQDVSYFIKTNQILKMMVDGKLYNTDYTLKEIEAKYHFYLRISKNTIINLNYVEQIKVGYNRKFIVTLTDGTKHEVNRSYYEKFQNVVLNGGKNE